MGILKTAKLTRRNKFRFHDTECSAMSVNGVETSDLVALPPHFDSDTVHRFRWFATAL